MKDSLSNRGASLWNFVNYNDKEASATINFNELMKRVSAEDYFIDLKSECTSASAIRCAHADNIILYVADHCVQTIYIICILV